MKIKNTIIALSIGLILPATATAAVVTPVVTDLSLTRSEDGSTLTAAYTIDRSASRIPSAYEAIVTPVIRFAGDSIELQPVIIAGRASYISHKRNHDLPKGTVIERAKGDNLRYEQTIPWDDKMMLSELTFRNQVYGCRCKCTENGMLPEMLAADFTPRRYELIIPRDQLAALEQNLNDVVKTRIVSKSAHVNFEVGKTLLLPNFGDNPAELAAITATIDSICCDKDVTVGNVHIHGYASPEGTYRLNTRLAAGRTEALRQYVDGKYNFGSKLTTASTPEDWQGLREWVAASALIDKDAILRLIDSQMADDAKELALQDRFPNTYKILLWEVYPTLRRSDYTIEYTVRNFSSPETIAEMLKTNPDKLSMEEVMLLARTYPVGSKERADLALRAAQLFPDDERAQLNGAFVALERQDLAEAARMLAKSGNSPLADYGRGVLAIYDGDKAKALPLLEKANAAGIQGAAEALQFAQEMK